MSAGPGSSHSIANEGNLTVLFDGLLHTRREWLNDFSLSTASDASLVLKAYLRWGEGVLERVKGLFALIDLGRRQGPPALRPRSPRHASVLLRR